MAPQLGPAPRPARLPLSYWCTWGAQNFARRPATATDSFLGDEGFERALNHLDEATVFGSGGWSEALPASARRRLLLVLDVGWDLPRPSRYPADSHRLGSLVPDRGRFPSAGGSPEESLTRLREMAEAAGWAGLGLWTSPQVPGRTPDGVSTDLDTGREYWAERARWCDSAGITYWKVDIGAASGDRAYRQMMTDAASVAPALRVEHGRNCGPLNDVPVPWETTPGSGTGRFGRWADVQAQAAALLEDSDVVRAYDVLPQLSVPTMLDRAAGLLQAVPAARAGAVLNLEDELYMAAALACSFGVMRHPGWLPRIGSAYDPTASSQRTAEIVRAVAWQHIAPPLARDSTLR